MKENYMFSVHFQNLGWQAWTTLFFTFLLLLLLVLGKVSAPMGFMFVLGVLLVLGILDVESALAGFSAPGMVTVGLMYIVVTGMAETGGLAWVSHKMMGNPKGRTWALIRMLLPVAWLSAFLNNTPVVAMFIPVVKKWAKNIKISDSLFLIPLSYAAIFGGMCTLIGTSTNLVVNTMVADHYQNNGLNMFEITKLGIICALVGFAYLITVGHRLLPANKPKEGFFKNPVEYTVELEVSSNSPLIGKSIEKSSLRNLPEAFLAELIRGDQVISAVSPQEVLEEKDRLVFVGNVDSVKSFYDEQGLRPAPGQLFKLDGPRHHRLLVEAVVSHSCPLVGKTIKEGRFRNIYNAVVIAVARNGERLKGKIGDIVLKTGDLLLIEAHAGFVPRQRDSRDFYLVSSVDDFAPRRFEKAPLAFIILASMVLLATFNVVPMLTAALMAAGAMLFFKCCSLFQAQKSIEWNVLIVIAAALGLGAALDQTGAAKAIASSLLGLVNENPFWALAMVFIITNLFTEIITNNGAVALVFPIASSTADSLGVNPMPFIICIMIGASASFSTPIGYQTNMMVYGPGGYKFSDYFKVGLPLNILVGITAVSLAPIFWPF